MDVEATNRKEDDPCSGYREEKDEVVLTNVPRKPRM